MSLDSSLWLSTILDAEAARDALTASGLFHEEPEIAKGLRLSADATLLTILFKPPVMGPFEDVGIRPTLHLFFANSDKENTAARTENTVRAVVNLLKADEGDALFVYCSDSPALLRKDGKLILDERCGVWKPGVEPKVLPLIDLPYQFGIIPLS
jgi:ABC-type molybdate transport system substrate-binding protein